MPILNLAGIAAALRKDAELARALHSTIHLTLAPDTADLIADALQRVLDEDQSLASETPTHFLAKE